MKLFPKIIALAIPIFVSVISCQSAKEKLAEKLVEEVIERQTGEKTDIEYDEEGISIKTENGDIVSQTLNAEWPKDLPASIPNLQGLKPTSVHTSNSTIGNTWTISYENMDINLSADYEKALKAKGFNTTQMKIGEYSALTGELDGVNVVLSIDANSKVGSLNVIQGKK